MAEAVLLICELLCYLFNRYGKSPDLNIKSGILSFFNSAEISVAKELLFKSVAKVDIDNLPRCVPRRKSDDKVKLEVEEIFGLIDYMDEHNALGKFPLFVAKNLERLPPFKTDALELCLAVKRINALEEKVEAASIQVPDPPAASDVKSFMII